MADSKVNDSLSSPKDPAGSDSGGSARGAQGQALSLLTEEELNHLIETEDPEFYQQMNVLSGANLEVSDIYEYEETEDDRDPLWGRPKGWRKVVKFIFPFAPRIARRFRHFRERLKWFLLIAIEMIKKLILVELPKLAKLLVALLIKVQKNIGIYFGLFKAWPLKRKMALFGIFISSLTVSALIFRTMTKGLFPPEEDLFIRSLESWAQQTYIYDPTEKREPFYDSTNVSRNIVLLPKLIANLRVGGTSGPNPMIALEIYLEGTSSEVMIEVKDREPQVRDLILRTIESARYQDLVEIEGKINLAEQIRRACNNNLNTGKIKKIFFKTFIMKP